MGIKMKKDVEYFVKKGLRKKGYNPAKIILIEPDLTKQHRYLPTTTVTVKEGTTDAQVKVIVNSMLKYCKKQKWQNKCEIEIHREE